MENRQQVSIDFKRRMEAWADLAREANAAGIVGGDFSIACRADVKHSAAS
jgi:hypothetical protein